MHLANYFNLFAYPTRYLLLVSLIFISGCTEVPRFAIHNGHFFEYSSEQPEVSVFKIVSQDELNQYIDKCQIEAVRKHLRDMEAISFARSFIYIAVNAELVDIRSVSGVAVSNAVLKKSAEPGLWVYVINGDPKVPIKAASE